MSSVTYRPTSLANSLFAWTREIALFRRLWFNRGQRKSGSWIYRLSFQENFFLLSFSFFCTIMFRASIKALRIKIGASELDMGGLLFQTGLKLKYFCISVLQIESAPHMPENTNRILFVEISCLGIDVRTFNWCHWAQLFHCIHSFCTLFRHWRVL